LNTLFRLGFGEQEARFREREEIAERERETRARAREREREREIIFEWKKFSCRGAWRRDSHRRLFTWAEKARCWIPGFGV
jgi:hypothetical protein